MGDPLNGVADLARWGFTYDFNDAHNRYVTGELLLRGDGVLLRRYGHDSLTSDGDGLGDDLEVRAVGADDDQLVAGHNRCRRGRGGAETALVRASRSSPVPIHQASAQAFEPS